MKTTINILRNEKNIREYSTGQTIFAEGDSSDGMYAVVDGEVDIVLGGELLETVRKGGVFGELALLDDEPRSATATARTRCKVAVIDRKRFTALVQQAPFFPLQVMKIMAERLRRKK